MRNRQNIGTSFCCLPAILVLALAVLGLSAVTLTAFPPKSVAGDDATQNLNLDAEGFALFGYDPVAYFTEGRAREGRMRYTATHNGAKYAFASDENRAAFLRNPEKYEPEYGGYCSYGLVHGNRSMIDPEVWDIVDGKIYFMISDGTKSIWLKNRKNYIEIADRAWGNLNAK